MDTKETDIKQQIFKQSYKRQRSYNMLKEANKKT